MKPKISLAILLTSLFLVPSVAMTAQDETKPAVEAPSAPQKETDREAKQDADKPPAEKAAKKPASTTLHILVTADTQKPLPDGSSVELKTDEESCGRTDSLDTNLNGGKATFAGVPLCKVKLNIFVTGFNSQTVTVDVSKCSKSVGIEISKKSAPKLSCS